jgi:hypothetical protein
VGFGCTDGAGPGNDLPLTFHFDFNEGTEGWIGGISDYPAEQFSQLQFLAGVQSLPPELKITGNALYLQSNNTPDDLFTFLKRRLTAADGIRPGRTYGMRYEVYLASRSPSGCPGAGGAPGESVYLKAGGSEDEPLPRVDNNNYVRLNVDKGEQAGDGPAASVVSNLANGIPCDLISDLTDVPYILLKRNHTHPFPVTASAAGELWLLVGHESGFEALTSVYFLEISVTLVPVAASP